VRRTNIGLVILVIGVLVATWAIPGPAQQKTAALKTQNKVVLGEDEVKRLLLLMDTDKNGRISKQEFMKFMEAEFDRLDNDKSGDLDVHELAQSQLQASNFLPVGR
jgi:Ca2+-binding EF-hand superfamily protein